MTTMQSPAPSARDRAIRRLRKRREFFAHVLTYALVNTFIVVIWAATSSDGFFWPVFPMGIWGIGLVLNAWDVWRGDEPSETAIRREMDRLQRSR